MIDLNLFLAGHDGLLSRQFHLNLLFLNVFNLFNVVLLLHLPLPSNEFRGILETHLHLGELIGVLALLAVALHVLLEECVWAREGVWRQNVLGYARTH